MIVSRIVCIPTTVTRTIVTHIHVATITDASVPVSIDTAIASGHAAHVARTLNIAIIANSTNIIIFILAAHVLAAHVLAALCALFWLL
jgi:hypothetical protein